MARAEVLDYGGFWGVIGDGGGGDGGKEGMARVELVEMAAVAMAEDAAVGEAQGGQVTVVLCLRGECLRS